MEEYTKDKMYLNDKNKELIDDKKYKIEVTRVRTYYLRY